MTSPFINDQEGDAPRVSPFALGKAPLVAGWCGEEPLELIQAGLVQTYPGEKICTAPAPE